MQYQESFPYIQEQISAAQQLKQHQIIQKIHNTNIHRFSIQLTSKKKTIYPQTQTTKIIFQDGSYLYYTDNLLIHKRFTILTVHGCPGDHVQWRGLQHEMNQYVRWINVIVPGYDGQDQRRGKYRGDPDDFFRLIRGLLKKLNIRKIVYCGHSLGSTYMPYLIQNYREYFQGIINMSGILHHWTLGLSRFYYYNVCQFGLNKLVENRNSKLQSNEFRKKLIQQHRKTTSEITFDGINKFPVLNQFQVCAYIKLMNFYPKGVSTLIELGRKMSSQNLILYIFGKNDPIIENHIIEQLFYNVIYTRYCPHQNQGFQNMYVRIKDRIYQRCLDEYNIKLDMSNLQSNFVFNFDDTGHNVHRRRPKEIAKIIKIYLLVCQEISKYQLQKSKL